MKRRPMIASLETITLKEALAYLDANSGDELAAASMLADDRNRLEGGKRSPDDTEIHHALFLLCSVRGMKIRSYDEVRVELRRRLAA